MNNLEGKAVLITGGTMGIGLATGLAFARQGAQCTLTYKWGTVEEDTVLDQFRRERLPIPFLVQADAASDEDTVALLDQMRTRFDSIEVFVSNVAFALLVPDIAAYSKRALLKSIEYSVWPFIEYPRQIKQRFGRYPRYIIGLSSSGPDYYCQSYDFVAASKSMMETLCRYLNYRLFEEDVRINIVRSRFIRTQSLRATFGEEFEPFAEQFNYAEKFISPGEVADVILALSSGLLDGVSGQVLMVDRGTGFSDNLMGFFDERECLSIKSKPTGGDKR